MDHLLRRPSHVVGVLSGSHSMPDALAHVWNSFGARVSLLGECVSSHDRVEGFIGMFRPRLQSATMTRIQTRNFTSAPVTHQDQSIDPAEKDLGSAVPLPFHLILSVLIKTQKVSLMAASWLFLPSGSYTVTGDSYDLRRSCHEF